MCKQVFHHNTFFCKAVPGFAVLIVSVFAGQKADDSYDFPYKDGKDFEIFSTSAEMLQACMIPENTLKTMSTDGLIKTCLNYPWRFNMHNWETYKSAMDAQIRDFNGLQELLRRKDAGTKLIERYRVVMPDIIQLRWTTDEKFEYKYDISYLEMILQRDEILGNLTARERNDLLAITIDKAEKRCCFLYDDSRHHMGWSLLICNLLEKQNVKPQLRSVSVAEFSTFVDVAHINISDDLLNDILLNGKAALNPDVLKRKSSPVEFITRQTTKDTTLKTPKGSTWNTKIHRYELSATKITELKGYHSNNVKQYGDKLITPEPYKSQGYGDSRFNCHSFALYWQDTLPKINIWLWDNSNGPRIYYTDGSLIPRQDTTSKPVTTATGVGTRVAFWTGTPGTSQYTHSYVVGAKQGKGGQSKWGQNPPYIHDMGVHPYGNVQMTYHDYPCVKYGAYDLGPTEINSLSGAVVNVKPVAVVHNTISIAINEPAGFSVYSMNGRLVQQEIRSNTGTVIINLKYLSNGVYTLVQKSGNGKTQFYKVSIYK